MKYIDEVPVNELKGRRVLLRADFNLPLKPDGEVANVFRVQQGWKTVRYLSEQGAKVIIVSHLGRDPEESMEPVARALKPFGPIVFIADLVGAAAKGAVMAMKDGEMLLLENVRRDPRETENDPEFARDLASLAELYVNDSFAADHREHASVVGITRFLPSYAGLLVRDEVENIDAARSPEHPSLAILGGAKFETKAPLIRLLLEKYDHLFITGALANDVFKTRGLQVGRSLISKELPRQDILSNPHLLAPVDVTVEDSSGKVSVKKPEEVGSDDKIADIGPGSVAMLAPHIASAKFILWSGPTGMYENGYVHYTQGIAELISKARAKTVIGGGDTVAAIEATGVKMGENAFLSTGGGAMLEYLLKGTLPAIAALG
jgi:phosphoglycerate kinase